MQKERQAHLTMSQRAAIETLLNEDRSIRYIARQLDKSPSTISREIRRNSKTYSPQSCDCLNHRDCKRKHICGSLTCNRRCSDCKQARSCCEAYKKAICDKTLSNKTGACNFCKQRKMCGYERRIYDGVRADEVYRKMLKDRREGFDLTLEALEKINNIVSPRIMQGQSVYHIIQTCKDELPVSESTIRRLIDRCELDARNIDLRNAVKRKQRAKHDNSYKRIPVIKEGHCYKDYLALIEHNPVPVVQMDCVEGVKEDCAVLLTLHFETLHMQLAVILPDHSSAAVVDALDKIEVTLGKELFATAFPLLLTDNGHEFSDVNGMERSIFGGKRTTVFFCEPNRSDEKGACENNHRLIRYCIPKGTSLELFMQSDITKMMNHINSFKRKSLFGKCPYDIARTVLPEDFFSLLGLEVIPPEDVVLKPSLFK